MGAMFTLKIYFSMLAAALVLVIITGASALAGIQNSKHDFSLGKTGTPFAGQFQVGAPGDLGDTIDEICVFCHTPHGASTDTDTTSFLWNRTNPQGSHNYTMYSSSTFTTPISSKPTGVSMMCMSCHDGVTSIAVNTLLNAPGSGNPQVSLDAFADIPEPGAIGSVFQGQIGFGWGPNIGNAIPGSGGSINLSNDHPISFEWLAGKAGYYAPGSQDPLLRLFGAAGNRVECSTCHKVHDNSIPPFLAMPNTNSDMCRSCHDK